MSETQVLPMPGLLDIPFDVATTVLSVPRHILFSGRGIPGIWNDVKQLPGRVWQDVKGTGTYPLGKPLIHLKLSDFDPAIMEEE